MRRDGGRKEGMHGQERRVQRVLERGVPARNHTHTHTHTHVHTHICAHNKLP